MLEMKLRDQDLDQRKIAKIQRFRRRKQQLTRRIRNLPWISRNNLSQLIMKTLLIRIIFVILFKQCLMIFIVFLEIMLLKTNRIILDRILTAILLMWAKIETYLINKRRNNSSSKCQSKQLRNNVMIVAIARIEKTLLKQNKQTIMIDILALRNSVMWNRTIIHSDHVLVLKRKLLE